MASIAGTISRPDQCPMCGSLNYTALNADGTLYNPFLRGQPLWDRCRCRECAHVWPFRIVHIVTRTPEAQ